MGIRKKLFALALSAVLLAVGLGAALYPWMAEERVDLEAVASMTVSEIQTPPWSPSIESMPWSRLDFQWSRVLQYMGVGAVLGAVSVRMMNRAKSIPITTS